MHDLKLIISFEDNYQVSRTMSNGKETYSTVTGPDDADRLTFGDSSKEKVKAYVTALSTDSWIEYDGRKARSARPEADDAFHQFLNHKLKLIYEDDRHLVYQAERKPRRKNSRQTQSEQP